MILDEVINQLEEMRELHGGNVRVLANSVEGREDWIDRIVTRNVRNQDGEPEPAVIIEA